jgi:hypothetical protein
MARCNIGNGKTVNFWTGLWEYNCLHKKFPHLITFAKHTYLTVENMFHLPLSHQAYEEFQSLKLLCQNALTTVQERNLDN